MRTTFIALSVAASLFLAACDRAKSPDTVAKEVASAEQQGAKEVASKENAAANDMDKAAAKVDDKVVDFNNQAAKDAYNVVLAKADADRNVAVANCNSLGGDAQSKCKAQADADYEAAKANAKAAAQSAKE
jgi:hypothetical protein